MAKFAARKPQQPEPAVARLGTWRRLWADHVKPILTAVVVALLIRQFVIQAFRIPTGSMEKTLLVGDFLFVNKFLYGAETPERLRVPLVNWTILSGLPVLKLPAIREPKQGDIIVFEYPLDRDQDYIKRCVAVAGDLVEVRNGLVFVNGSEYEDDLDSPEADTTMRPDGAHIKPHTNHDPSRATQALNQDYGLAQSLAVRSMTPRLFLQLIDSALAGGAGLDAEIVAPHLEALRAHVNEEQTLTMAQLRPHLQALHAHAAEVDAPYVVPEGHLFMMGDNRYNSADSRYWGPLDTDLIKGKAMFIYWSWDKERNLPRFSRLGDLIK
jgi:signal peptidase I